MLARPTFKIVWLLFVALVLSACGDDNNGNLLGNDQDNTLVATLNTVPTVNAGSDQNTFERQKISLIGHGHDTGGERVSYQWQQTAGQTVQIDSNNTANAKFVAPMVKKDSLLTFELTVSNNDGVNATDSVNVTVSPNSTMQISHVTFTDAKLASCVQNTAAANHWSTVGQLHTLTCANKGINNIGGLQNLTSLRTLDLSLNNITTLAPLAQLTSLTQLNLAANGLVNIESLAQLVGLTQLNLGAAQSLGIAIRNAIRDITPLTDLTGLVELDLNHNRISDISSLQGLPALIKVGLNHNQIRDIQALLNVNNATSVDLRDNDNITCAALNELESMVIQGRVERPSDCIFTLDIRIADIYFADQNLQSCVLDTASSEGWITISEMTALSCDEQYLTDLTGLQSLKALHHLDLRDNQIVDISALFDLTATATLDLSQNQQIACARLDALSAIVGDTVLKRPVNCAPLTLISDLDFIDPVLEACVHYTANLYQWTLINDMHTLRCDDDKQPTQAKITDLRGIDQLSTLTNVYLANRLDNTHNATINLLPLVNLTNASVIDLSGNNQGIVCKELDLLQNQLNATIEGPANCQ